MKKSDQLEDFNLLVKKLPRVTKLTAKLRSLAVSPDRWVEHFERTIDVNEYLIEMGRSRSVVLSQTCSLDASLVKRIKKLDKNA